ncbi:TPA: hypothetical protein ACGO2M_000841 [Streptococcus suis]
MNEIFKLFGTIGLNNREANKGIDETTDKAQSASSKIAGFFKKAAVAIGTVFAAGKLIDFGKTAVEAAAGAKAIQAQFEQVFGDLQGESLKAIDAMAKEFGMVPSRLKPSMTKMTSMFKGLGMDTEEAMTQASDAVRLSADAAAFYDVSYESANQSLTSFIKGNYEGGEAIGIFANETQMAQFAIQKGLVGSTAEWSALDEATKQATRLEYAQNMQELGGATGQASREADGFENVMGNVKQAWQDFLALVGGPILEPVVGALQRVTEWLQKAGGKVQEFQGWFAGFRDEVVNSTAFQTLSDIFQQIADRFTTLKDNMADSGVFDNIKHVFADIKDAILEIDFNKLVGDIGAFIEKFASLIAGVAAGYVAFKVITAAINAWKVAMAAAQVVMLLVNNAGTIMAIVMAGINLPIVLLVAAIAGLVAAGVWLWQNWDMVKAKATEIWGAISSYLSGLWEGIKTTASNVWNAIKSTISNVWEGIKSAVSDAVNAVKNTVSSIFEAVKNTVSNIWNGIKSTTSSVWEGVKSAVSNAVNGIKSTVSNVFEGVKSTVSNIWDGIKSKITGAIDGAKNAVSNAISAIKGIMNFSWSLPKLKMPHFSFSGKFSLNPPSVPKFGIEWYKDGGILTKAMAFGMNGNDVMVGGEAGKEAVLPLNRETLGGIGEGIATSMGWGNDYIAEKLDAIIDLLINFFTGYNPNAQVVMDTGALVGAIKAEMSRQLGNDINLRGRGR